MTGNHSFISENVLLSSPKSHINTGFSSCTTIARKDLSMSLILANVRSICNKLDILKLFLVDHRLDILAVTESWGRPALLDAFLTLDNYTLFRQDRCDRFGGGVFLLVRKDLRPSYFPTFNRSDVFEDSIWCTIPVSSSKRLLIGCLYRSPSSSPLNNNRLVDLFDNVAAEQIDYKVLVGDFNCPDINWDLMSSSTSSQFLLDSCSNNFFTQLVNTPTRGNHILDLIFVNDVTFVSDILVGDSFPGSDHETVSCSLIFDP